MEFFGEFLGNIYPDPFGKWRGSQCESRQNAQFWSRMDCNNFRMEHGSVCGCACFGRYEWRPPEPRCYAGIGV
jgi:hypothetical protein